MTYFCDACAMRVAIECDDGGGYVCGECGCVPSKEIIALVEVRDRARQAIYEFSYKEDSDLAELEKKINLIVDAIQK
jgi:pyruvate/2-oxoglutarate dehydrogenase complex dihydrolipoamide dehydrogenase (E3) component